MAVNAREQEAGFREWLEKINTSNKLIIVEGKKDAHALCSLGVNNHVVMLSKKPLYAVVEDVAEKTTDVIILTDFDKKGKELYGKLKKSLIAHGVQVDNTFREFLQNTGISHIEGLKTHVQKYIKGQEL
ncbi:MAG: toprim domain-containing protein [Candidatus Woesearchaeota archaeon]|nr:toprim domain-containing protein [Candidatus Woesearchaeota archaeon]